MTLQDLINLAAEKNIDPSQIDIVLEQPSDDHVICTQADIGKRTEVEAGRYVIWSDDPDASSDPAFTNLAICLA